MPIYTRIKLGPFVYVGRPGAGRPTAAKPMGRASKILLAAVSLLFIALPLGGALLHWIFE